MSALALTYGVAGLSAALAAGVAGVVAIAAWRALVRTGNRGIVWVVAGFAILALKLLVKGVALASGVSEGPGMELAFTLADLAALLLIAWPIVAGGRA